MARERFPAVSEATTHRLSLVLRSLRQLDAEGTWTISSRVLAERFGLNSAQIRKDLAQFGEFGVRGVGYRVGELKSRLEGLMGLDNPRTIAIVGAGHLGQALADSRNFNGSSFRVAALFDTDGRKIGSRTRTGVPIRALSDLPGAIAEIGAEIGVVAVPAEFASASAGLLVSGGVRALLNFAAATIGPFPGVPVKNVDMTLFLENLSFQLRTKT